MNIIAFIIMRKAGVVMLNPGNLGFAFSIVKRRPLSCLVGVLLSLLPYLAYGGDQAIEPSNELLKLVGASAYKLSENIKLKVTKDDIKSLRGISVCDQSSYVPLLISSRIPDVIKIKAAIETESLKQQAMLFSIHNEGGLSRPHMSHMVSLNLDRHDKLGVMNIWIFYFTDKTVYANLVQAQCVLKDYF